MSDRGGAFSPLVELTTARLREFVREPEALFWVVVFPILLAFALGIAFPNRGEQPVLIGVEQTDGAEALARTLQAARGIRARLVRPADAERALRNGEVQLVVVPGAPPTYRYDPTRTESRLARLVVDSALQRASGRTDAWQAGEEHVDNVGSRYIDWLIPGLLGVNIMSTGLWGIGFSVVQARTKKLLKRLVATPMRRSQYLLAHLLARLVFLGVEVGALLVFARLAFGVPIRGSLLTLVGIAVVGALSFGGLGLLLASRARTLEAISGLMNVVTLPLWVLSGVFFSSANFPAAMQPVIRVLPLTALNDALRAVMLDGAPARALGGEVAVMAAWGLGSFAIAVKIFRWR
jgi:ABC-type multidrug transport system permease subunit